jgi:hypothetical protein
MEKKSMVPIWFFIGVILLVYGAIITGVSVYDLFVTPVRTVVLQNLHAGVWWGAFLLLVGLLYTIKFWPAKSDQ